VILLYVLNLALAAAVLFVPAWFSRRYLGLPLLNPITITMLVWLPFELMKLLIGPAVLIDGGLWDSGFQYAILMANVFALSQTAGMVFFFKVAGAVRVDRYLPFRDMYMSPKHLARASYVFLAIFVFAFVSLANAELGVLAWLQNPRLGYQTYRVGQGHWYALAMSALAGATLLSFVATPRTWLVMAKSIVFLYLAYLLGSKGVMLGYFIAALVVLWFIRPRYVITALIMGAPVIFAVMVWNLYLALSNAFELQSIIEYFDYYRNGADYYRAVLNGEIPLFHGQVFVSSFWSYVPRALVPDKPFVYGVLHVNEIFFPGAAEETNTPAFGGAVEQYADFGAIGVVLFGFFSGQSTLNALLYYLVFRTPGFTLKRVTLGALIAFLALAAPNFGGFFPGALYWLFLAAVAVLIRAARLRLTPVQPAQAGSH
jgi:hypothetical protein